MSVSTEDFLKVLYRHSHDPGLDTRPGSVARALEVSQAATTDMARKLSARGLVRYEKYRKLKLTPEGEREAIGIIRKHRLWEAFLHKTLRMSLNEIHREAEKLEHQTSDFLAGRIADYLDDPRIDPHGDPIPDENGTIVSDDQQYPLSKSEPGAAYTVARLHSTNQEFFEFCQDRGISMECRIEVVRHYPENGLTEVLVNDQVLLLSRKFTGQIHVKKYAQSKKEKTI